MRSLSPSRTFTCTRTVSPDLIAGRSANCDCSTTSMAPIVLLLLSVGDGLHGRPDSARPLRACPTDVLYLVSPATRAEFPVPHRRATRRSEDPAAARACASAIPSCANDESRRDFPTTAPRALSVDRRLPPERRRFPQVVCSA